MFKRFELPSTPDDKSTSEIRFDGEGNKTIKSITPVSVELELPVQAAPSTNTEAEAKLKSIFLRRKVEQTSESGLASSSQVQPEPAKTISSASFIKSQLLKGSSETGQSRELGESMASKWKIAKRAKVFGKIALQKKEILNKNYGIDESTADKGDLEEKIKCILPDNIYIKYWQRLMWALTFYLVFPYVFRVCLLPFEKDFLFFIEIFMQSCFLVDVVLNFFLAYYERDDLVTDLRSIMLHYIFTFFLFDLMAAIPFNLITLTMDFKQGEESHRIFRLFAAFRIVKFLMTIVSYEGWKDISFFAKRSPTIIRLIKILVLLIYFVHFSACAFVLLAKIDGSNRSWIFVNNSQDFSSIDLYTLAIYWSTQTIVTVGFGDINLNTNGERFMALVLMYIGSAVYSFMISNLGAVVEEADTFETTLKTKINSFKTLAKETNLPEELVQKVKKFIESNHKHNPRTSMHDQSFINELPFTLKAQLMFNINARVVEGVPFLKDKDVDFILKMAPNLKPVELLPKEILFRENEYPEDVYFLTQGIIHLKGKTGVPLYVVSEGEMFGDIEVLQNIARITTAQAQTRCSLYSIEKEMFTEILNGYSSIKDSLLSDAHDKKKRLLDLKKRCRDDTNSGAQIQIGSHLRTNIMNAADYANRMYEKPTDKFEREISTYLEKGVGKKYKMKYVKRLAKQHAKENPVSTVNESLAIDKEYEIHDGLSTKKQEEVFSEINDSQMKSLNISKAGIPFADEGYAVTDAELVNKKKKEYEEQYFEQAEKLGSELLTTIDTLEECNNNMKKQESKYARLMHLIQAIEDKQKQINSRVEGYKKKLETNRGTTAPSDSTNSNIPGND